MSFNREARRVRDGALPYGRRVNSLGACVQMYRPIGYRWAWRYIKERAGGDVRRDPEALVRALDVLVAPLAPCGRNARSWRGSRWPTLYCSQGPTAPDAQSGLIRSSVGEGMLRWRGDRWVRGAHVLGA